MNVQSPPTTMRDLTKRLKGMGLSIESSGTSKSGHLRVVRPDGVVIARMGATPSRRTTIINEFKRIEKRAAQEAGGRWNAST